MQLAEAIVAPLQLLQFKQLAIRLGQNPNRIVRQFCQRVVTELAPATVIGSKRYVHLPREIQERILEFSGLVSEWDVRWDPIAGYTCQRECCRQCSPSLKACFCPTRHAAYSSMCNCTQVPLSLFQVSRDMRALAIRIFFSQNQFHILPRSKADVWWRGSGSQMGGIEDQSELALFLERIPAEGLSYLRRVRWILPVVGAEYLSVGSDGYTRYVSGLRRLAESEHAWQLWLTVDMTAERGDDWRPGPETSWPEREAEMWTVYQRIISPFSCLQGLQHLSVYASWPILFSQRAIRPQWESRLEQMILGGGEDRRAKWKRTDGGWILISERDDWEDLPLRWPRARTL